LKLISHKKLIFFVLLSLLVVFLPSFFAEVTKVDDVQLLARLNKITDFNFLTFIRGGTGLYYRPIIGASYKLDAFLFNANPYAMHAENILLHIVNVFLLISILRMIFNGNGSRYIAYFCGFLWGIHPLTTESVAWISGRSDVLATTFIFLSALFLLFYRRSNKHIHLVFMLFTFVLGYLTKEVMLPFFILIVLLLRARDPHLFRYKKWSLLEGKGLALWLIPVVVSGIIFLRVIAYNAVSGRIQNTLLVIFNDTYYSFFVCLRSFGFYIKKIIYPFPLNFGIMEVDPLYELLAIPLLALCFFLLFKRDNLSALFLGGAVMLTPAFLIAFGQIAWTPYAERYAYLPSAFILPGVISYFHTRLEFPSHRFKLIVVVMFVGLVAASTFHRNLVWRTNESIVADTAIKSPYNPQIQATYANILIESGNYEEAMIAINKARAVSTLVYYPNPDILEANILEQKAQLDDAINVLRHGVEKSNYSSELILQALINTLEIKVESVDEGSSGVLLREISDLHLNKFKLNNNFSELFSMAGLAIKMDESDRAVLLLNQVLRNVNIDSTLGTRARSLLATVPTR
jgi:tetratricopeptide (TPR) repeat protein